MATRWQAKHSTIPMQLHRLADRMIHAAHRQLMTAADVEAAWAVAAWLRAAADPKVNAEMLMTTPAVCQMTRREVSRRPAVHSERTDVPLLLDLLDAVDRWRCGGSQESLAAEAGLAWITVGCTDPIFDPLSVNA